MAIACFIRYQIDPLQREASVAYAVNRGRIIPRCGARLIGSFDGTFNLPAGAP